MSGLTLFDARPKCESCRRPYSGPTWEVIDERAHRDDPWRISTAALNPWRFSILDEPWVKGEELHLDVCSECAHNFRRKRQRLSVR